MIKYTLKVVDIKKEASSTYTYYLEKPANTSWKEGSHTHIGIAGFDAGEVPNKSLVRHMSIMTLPDENKIGFTTRFQEEMSPFKEALKEVKVGDNMSLFKVGSRMGLRREDRPIVLISMGVGLATMRPIILEYKKNDNNIPYLVNITVDNTGEFLYKDELDKLQEDTYNNVWVKNRQELYAAVQKAGRDFKDAIYYIVGSDDFLRNMIKRLTDSNVKLEDIVVDKREEGLKKLFEEV